MIQSDFRLNQRGLFGKPPKVLLFFPKRVHIYLMTNRLFPLTLVLLLMLNACTKIEKMYLIPERDEIVEAIHTIIRTDGVFSIDGLNDLNAYFADYTSSTLGKVAFPDTADYDISDIKIGRKITQITDTLIAYDIKWDSAYVNIKYYLRGSFDIVLFDHLTDSTISDVNYITEDVYDTTGFEVDSSYLEQFDIWDYDTTFTIDTNVVVLDSVITWDYQTVYSAVDSISKNFTHQTEQRAIFIRTQNTNNAAKDWKLEKITPLIFYPTDESFRISEVVLSMTGSPSSITLSDQENTDLLDTYFRRDVLPKLDYPGNLTITSAMIINENPFPQNPGELVMAHFGHAVNIYKIRTGLTDTNNDSSHQGGISVNSHGQNIFRLFIDAIDYNTIFTRAGQYNAHLWMIPFQVP